MATWDCLVKLPTVIPNIVQGSNRPPKIETQTTSEPKTGPFTSYRDQKRG